MKRTIMTEDRHRDTGHRFRRAKEELMHIGITLSNAYGKTHHYTKALHKSLKILKELRCQLDSQFCRDFPKADIRNGYYGPVERITNPMV